MAPQGGSDGDRAFLSDCLLPASEDSAVVPSTGDEVRDDASAMRSLADAVLGSDATFTVRSTPQSLARRAMLDSA